MVQHQHQKELDEFYASLEQAIDEVLRQDLDLDLTAAPPRVGIDHVV